METKFVHCIYFESVTTGIQWFVARRDNKKRIVSTGFAETYAEAVEDSDKAFNEIPKQNR